MSHSTTRALEAAIRRQLEYERERESADPLPLRHAGHARLLTEAEIREIEAETGHRL